VLSGINLAQTAAIFFLNAFNSFVSATAAAAALAARGVHRQSKTTRQLHLL